MINDSYGIFVSQDGKGARTSLFYVPLNQATIAGCQHVFMRQRAGEPPRWRMHVRPIARVLFSILFFNFPFRKIHFQASQRRIYKAPPRFPERAPRGKRGGRASGVGAGAPSPRARNSPLAGRWVGALDLSRKAAR